MRTAMKVAGLAAALLLVACEPSAEPSKTSDPVNGTYAAPAAAPVGSKPTAPRPALRPRAVLPQSLASPLLRAASGGDGDSWKDTAGREYRLGLVNAPEYNECFGSVATAKRKALTASGFRARVYTKDTYGRRVAVVTTAAGTNVNVYLARHGFANDRYLSQFRAENPALARQLDTAFAVAKRERAGLWGACGRVVAQPAPLAAPRSSTDCHPAYATCIPVKGDGSGSGSANDLDCPDIGKSVRLKQIGLDPYRLDANGDGMGCDSYA